MVYHYYYFLPFMPVLAGRGSQWAGYDGIISVGVSNTLGGSQTTFGHIYIAIQEMSIAGIGLPKLALTYQ